MKKVYKTIIILNTFAIIVFSITMLIGIINLFNKNFDLRYGGIIFLVSMWSYSIGLLVKERRKLN